MLTSRSEYRLALRSDNADARLTPIGRECNLIDDDRFRMFEDKRDAIENELVRLKKIRLKESSPLVAAALEQSKNLGVGGKQSFTLEELLRRPGVTYDKFVEYKRRVWNRPDPETSDKMGSRVRGNSRQIRRFHPTTKSTNRPRLEQTRKRNSIRNRLQRRPNEVRSARKTRKKFVRPRLVKLVESEASRRPTLTVF